MELNVAQLVLERARQHPASPAIITHDEIITYGGLGVAIGAVARHLRKQGVTSGQIVGISMGQNVLHVVTRLALAQVGAVSLPLHVAVPQDRRILAARRFGAVLVVSGRDEMALPDVPFMSLANVSPEGSSIPPDSEIHQVTPDTPFCIAISSGTSGDPKGMLVTHTLMANRNRRPEPGFTVQSRVIPMDMTFAVGFGPVIRTLAASGCVVLPKLMNAEQLLHAAISHGVTHLTLSPAQAQSMVDLLATGGIRCPSLVCLRIGGGPLTTSLLQEVREKLSPNVHVMYGSTEASIISYASPAILDQHPSSVGQINSWARAEVVDENNRILPTGETGMLRMRSEDQVSGYYRNEELTHKHFRDGWFYPGDLGRFDDEGLLYIEGRVDDQLNIGGHKVNPEDIDATLMAHPQVMEAGAFVLTGEEGAEMLAAAIVLREGGVLRDIQRHASARLGPLAPAKYFVVPSLPRTLTGKLRRNELTTQFSSIANT